MTDDPLRWVGLILAYALIHQAAHWWSENTTWGRLFKAFCVTWRTDSLTHLVLCAGSVFIWGLVGIFTLALTFRVLGI